MVKIKIKIKKKDLWLLSAIIVFLVAVGYVIAYNPSISGGNPTIMGHSSDEVMVRNNSNYEKSLQQAINDGDMKGPQGIQGIQGPTGLKGDIGLKGDKGDRGDRGLNWSCQDFFVYEHAGCGGCYGGWIQITCFYDNDDVYKRDIWTCCPPY